MTKALFIFHLNNPVSKIFCFLILSYRHVCFLCAFLCICILHIIVYHYYDLSLSNFCNFSGSVFYIIALLYVIFFIKEPKKPVFEEKKNILVDIFDPRHAIDTFALLVKKIPGNSRMLIVTTLLVTLIYNIINQGGLLLLLIIM